MKARVIKVQELKGSIFATDEYGLVWVGKPNQEFVPFEVGQDRDEDQQAMEEYLLRNNSNA